MLDIAYGYFAYVTDVRVGYGELASGAGTVNALAAEVGAMRSVLDRSGRSAAAAGGPRAVASVSAACAAWSNGLGSVSAAIGQLHGNLDAAARAYAETDEAAIRAR